MGFSFVSVYIQLMLVLQSEVVIRMCRSERSSELRPVHLTMIPFKLTANKLRLSKPESKDFILNLIGPGVE